MNHALLMEKGLNIEVPVGQVPVSLHISLYYNYQ